MAVDETLVLDIRRALSQVEQLQRAVTESLSDGGRAGATSIINELRRGESVRLSLPAPEIDTGHLAPQIQAAVAAASTTVDPSVASGSTGDITGAIDAAVDAANTSIDVTADVTGADALAGACDQAKCVDDNLKKSTESAGGLGGALKGVVGALAAAGAADFFKDAVGAAAEFGDQLSKVQVVFGDFAAGIEDLASTSAESMGLSSTSTLELAGSFGVLLQSFGIAQGQAAEFSANLVGLSGDLASFNGIAGGATEVGQRLVSALQGQTDSLTPLGIVLSADAIKAYAYANGIARVGTELTNTQRATATYGAIVAGAALASGDFQNTIDSLPNQLNILRASFDDTKVTIGNQLLPVVGDFVKTIRDEGLPALEKLASGAVPAIIAALSGLMPLFATGSTLLVALAPLIEQVGAGLERIPGPALAVAAGVFGIVRAIQAINAAMATSALTGFQEAMIAVGAAVAITAAVLGSGAGEARRHQQAVEDLTAAVYDNRDAFDSLDEAFAAFIADTSEFSTGTLRDQINDLGIGSEELGRLAHEGAAGFAEFIDTVKGSGKFDNSEVDDLVNSFGDLSTETLQDRAATEGYDQSLIELIGHFEELQSVADEAAEGKAKDLILTGELSKAAYDYAVAQQAATGNTIDYSRALEDAQIATGQQAGSLERQSLLTGQAAVAGQNLARHTEEQTAAIRDLRGELDPANAAVALTATQMGVLTAAMAGGALSTEDFARLADTLGVSVETLAAAESTATDDIQQAADDQKAALEEQAAAVDAMKQSILQDLPEAAAAFEGFNEAADLQKGIDKITEQANAFADKQGDLADLIGRGFTDLATSLREASPELVNAAQDMSDEALTTLEAQIDTANQRVADATPTMEANAAAFIGATGGAFTGAAAAVTDADLAGTAGGEIDQATAAVEAQSGTSAEIFIAARRVGSNIPEGIESGALISRNGMLIAMRALGRSAVDAVADGAGVHSPSELTAETGADMAKGLKVGVERAYDRNGFAIIGKDAATAIGDGFAVLNESGRIAANLAAAHKTITDNFNAHLLYETGADAATGLVTGLKQTLEERQLEAIGKAAAAMLGGAFEDTIDDILESVGLDLADFVTTAESAATGVTTGLTIARPLGDRYDFITALDAIYAASTPGQRKSATFAGEAARAAEAQIAGQTFHITVNEANDAETTAQLVSAQLAVAVG